ncbi:uncharacterized protein V6R79_024629 [Siganus canaliculatus]
MDVSVKYQEIIKQSLLVRSGSPAVYHLTPKKEIIGTNMTKLTVGEKDPEKTNRTVLLVGETGTGKSTLINALVNYTMGVKWEDNVWFKVVVEGGAEGGNQAESQTSDVVVYQIFGFEGQTLPYSLTIIDTPGFGSTAGHEYDIIISQRLLDLSCSENGVHEINVVGLVLKSTENRLTERLRYILDSVMSLFGKDMEKNIVALITHSDGLSPENALQALEEAKIKVSKDEEGETIHFLFNNLQSRQRTQKETVPLKFAWEISTGGMSQFQDFLEKTAPVDILSDQTRLTAWIQNLQQRVEFIEFKLEEIQQAQEAVKRYHQKRKSPEKLTGTEQRKTGAAKPPSLLEDLEEKMSEARAEKHQLLDKFFQLLVKLEQTGGTSGSLSIQVHLDFLVDKMKDKGDTAKVQKLKEMRNNVRRSNNQPSASGTARNSNVSLKLQEIIKKSLLVRSGSPAVYHLKPKKEIIGTNMTKLTVGEKDLKKTNRTILLVGETGAGKSTLINTLVNYTMGVKWEDNVWFKVVVEGGAEGGNQAESQTSDVVVYQIFGFEDQTLPYSLTIIDTPGFGDTRGIEKDAIISQRLLELFKLENGVHEISAVGLVLKSTENRLKDEMRYILDSVMSLFGKGMEKNIVALITHSDGIDPGNALQALEEAKIKVAKDEEGETIHFMFNNRQTTERTKKNRSAMKSAWDMTTDQIHQFTEFLDKAEPQSVVTAVEVLNDRIQLTACIQNLRERVEFMELKQREIKETQEALEKHELELKNDKNFTVEVEEPYKVREIISFGWWGLSSSYGMVCCLVCEENCHLDFPLVLSPINYAFVNWSLSSCKVMKNGRCTSCSGKCSVSDHVKAEWRYVTKTRKVKKTLVDVRRKYERDKSDTESLLKELQTKVIKLEIDKDRWLDEAFQHIMSLEQIALNVDSLSTYVHLDVLIKKMKERGDTEKVKKLEEIKRRMEKDEKKSKAQRFMTSAAAKAGAANVFGAGKKVLGI